MTRLGTLAVVIATAGGNRRAVFPEALRHFPDLDLGGPDHRSDRS